MGGSSCSTKSKSPASYFGTCFPQSSRDSMLFPCRRVKRSRVTLEQQANKERQRQIQDHKRLESVTGACELCADSARRPKHLTIALGNLTYLRLPSRGRLLDGHVQIVTAEHVGSTRMTDEATWQEIRNFKKSLVRMFLDQKKEVLFLETAMDFSRGRAHAVIDCIPVPQDTAQDVRPAA